MKNEKLSALLKWGWQSPVTAAVILFLLGISPVGFAVPYFALIAMDLCSGALGSGVQCSLPFGAGYFATLAMYLEVSCFIYGFCLVWLIAAVAVWAGFLVYAGRAAYLLIRPA